MRGSLWFKERRHSMLIVQSSKLVRLRKLSEDCGGRNSVGRAATSDTRGQWFKSSHCQSILSVNYTEKIKIQKKRPWSYLKNKIDFSVSKCVVRCRVRCNGTKKESPIPGIMNRWLINLHSNYFGRTKARPRKRVKLVQETSVHTGGSPGLWEKTNAQEVVSSNPTTTYWMEINL